MPLVTLRPVSRITATRLVVAASGSLVRSKAGTLQRARARGARERGSEVSTPSMVSRPSSRRRAPSLALLALLALLATAVNRVGASEETLVAVPLVVSGAAGPDPDPVSCAAEFFPADFDRDGTLAPCFRVASMRDDDVNDGEEEEAQLCDACVTAVGDVLLPRMLAAGMDPTIADAVAACLYAALPAATDAGVPVFAVVDRCDLLSLGAAGALARNTPEVEKATESTAFEPTEPTDEPTEPTELPEPTRPKPEPRPRDPRYPDTGLTAAADAAEAIDGDEERSKRATPGATTAVFAAGVAVAVAEEAEGTERRGDRVHRDRVRGGVRAADIAAGGLRARQEEEEGGEAVAGSGGGGLARMEPRAFAPLGSHNLYGLARS